MNQQPDKFFREKLDGFPKAAPAAAWDRIEAGLAKKDNSIIWTRVAAAVVLLAVASFVIWNTITPSVETPPQLTKHTESAPVKESTAPAKEQVKESPVIVSE